MDAYHKIGVPMGNWLWSLWGSFVAIVGASVIAYILLPLTGIQYTSLALLLFIIIVVLLWLILTFDNLREGSTINRITSLETQLRLTRDDVNGLSISLLENIQAMKEHGL